MSQIAVVYWSGTGNTEVMANAIVEGVRANGAAAEIFTPDGFTPELADTYEVIAFGCPSMGAEELEETEFEPMFTQVQSKLSGKKMPLFVSYGWGDGEWRRSGAEQCKETGSASCREGG